MAPEEGVAPTPDSVVPEAAPRPATARQPPEAGGESVVVVHQNPCYHGTPPESPQRLQVVAPLPPATRTLADFDEDLRELRTADRKEAE